MILDTNAVSAIGLNDSKIISMLQRQAMLFVPVIVIGEYRYGISGSRKQRETAAWFDSFLRTVQILDVTEETASEYAVVRRQLKESGTPIPADDVWIAALALQHDMPLVTRDAHFDNIAGLRRIDW